ncbi:MAG: hypothetical protein L3J35_12820 [Bacteroidales bacterium]|nr:hypothetical protein [Bacteroidales bacterium]
MKKLMHFLFLSCLKATELIEKKLHIKLSLKEKLRLNVHKSMCNVCRRYDKQSKIMDEALKKHNHKIPQINIEELKLSIKKKISEQ